MTVTKTNGIDPRKPLRVWPGVVMAIVLVLARYVLPRIAPDAELFGAPLAIVGVLAGMLGSVAIVAWWMFFSRAPWSERVGALVLMIVAMVATKRVVHESIRGGNMGLMLLVYAPPVLSVSLVVWAVATRHLRDGARRALLVVTILLACGVFTLIRTDGVMGAGSQITWRWTPTAEQQLLAKVNDEPKPLPPPAAPAEIPKEPLDSGRGEPPAAEVDEKRVAEPAATVAAKTAPAARAATETAAEWPGFRGPGRDSVIRGVRINTDWSASPPVQMWRRPIGPGWSSFAVQGGIFYTQEQRGEEEVVTAYKVSTGQPVWRHRDPVRFWESNGGAGPRGTPTLSNGRVFTLGATGILNALDAGNGAVVWSRNAAADTAVQVPVWAFSSSPLVVDDLVIVATAGALAAYDRANGKRRWLRPSHEGSYSSPHLATIDGVAQILLLAGAGTTSVAPADGKVLWEYAWPGVPIVQPALTANGDVLITSGDAMGGMGIRRIALARGPGGWKTEERWMSRGLKPYFNDFVVHEGHAYGFDGSILACIDLEDGVRKWKGGRYGNGQLVLLPDQNLLLVLSEDGELALVSATPDKFTEFGRLPAIEGKTWNHPVLVGDVLLVRNGEEMAAFRLSGASR